MAKKQAEEFAALKAAIRDRQPARLYIFHGEETFLMRHYLERLRKLLIDEATASFNDHKLTEENFQVQELEQAVNQLPFMAEHTMVVVDEVELFRRKLSKQDREELSRILSDIPPYCTVVFTYTTTPWKPDRQEKTLYATLNQYAHVVEFAKQERRDLISWATRHFAAEQKRISPELCGYLVDITDGTMTALGGEIAKICAYSGAQEITRSDIDAVTEPTLDAVVFQMTDLLAQGAYGPAVEKLRQLLKMQQEPVAILGAIGAHIRRMGGARTLLDRGRPASELMQLYAIGEYPAKKAMASAKRFSPQFCEKAAELVMQTDYKMKTSFDDPDRLLEILVLQLAQEAQND